MAKKLEVKDLIISFRTNNGTVKAVRDISFDLDAGETLAIVGESGSGKSVTARAIMGILAGNAIPEGGEIIYDGQDLMKISEEDFHKIRGNRISMIFQDPLSSLNPIVKIGTQLTEAMILNGKANQREAKRIYSNKIKLLANAMKSAGVENVDSKIKIIDAAIKTGSNLETKYNYSRERVESAIKNIGDILVDVINGEPKTVAKEIKLLISDSSSVYNPFLVPENDASYARIVDELKQKTGEYVNRGDHTELDKVLKELKDLLETVFAYEKPNFFAIGYCKNNNLEPLFEGDIPRFNAECAKLLDDAFLTDALQGVAAGLQYSNDVAYGKKQYVVDLLDAELARLESEERIDPKLCREKTAPIVKAVVDSLDMLAIDKDSVAFTYKSTVTSAVEIYNRACKVEKMNHPGKKDLEFKNRMDIELYQNNIKIAHTRLRDAYVAQLQASNAIDYDELAKKFISYLDDQASRSVYRVTKRKATIRAIELMDEVGISDARRRFKQYPFEFSGGMRQRIVIAIALAANPDVLICDEPTTALDVTIQAQILELINKLKKERDLSIIFITHDLGVVANMADKIAVMYAGKIVEYGSADDIFYSPAHPYTWALLASMPDLDTKEKLDAIPGTPPNMIFPPVGDAFAERNKYAMEIDFEEQPPMFKINDTHWAATWLLHPDAPKVEPPKLVTDRIERMKKLGGEQ